MDSIVKFEIHGDERGLLVALDAIALPFEPKRVFYMYETKPGVVRGNHAHILCNQVLICVSGSCKVTLDNGECKETFLLDKPYEGLYVRCNLWRQMYDFSENAILLVVSDQPYDENDYIRNYNEFLKYYLKQ